MQVSIAASRKDPVVVGAESNTLNPVLVAFQRHTRGRLVDGVPHTHRAALATGRDPSVFVRKRNAEYRVLIAAHGLDRFCATGDIPQPDGSIEAARHDLIPVRAEADTEDVPPRLPRNGLTIGAEGRLDIPYLYQVVLIPPIEIEPRAGNNLITFRTERDAPHLIGHLPLVVGDLVGADGANQSAALRIPQPHHTVEAAGDDLRPIRAEGDTLDPWFAW